MPNKIEQSLSLDDLRALVAELAAASAAPTLKQIQEAAARRGVRVSLMGASAFRDKNFEGYLAELRRKSEAATLIAEATAAGGTAADAAAALGSDLILDQLMAGTLEGEGLDRAMLTISRLRAGNQASAKLRADLALRDEQIAKLQAEATARAEKAAAAKAALETISKSKGGLTPETLKRIEEAAGLL
jgi:hypothetical protein